MTFFYLNTCSPSTAFITLAFKTQLCSAKPTNRISSARTVDVTRTTGTQQHRPDIAYDYSTWHVINTGYTNSTKELSSARSQQTMHYKVKCNCFVEKAE